MGRTVWYHQPHTWFTLRHTWTVTPASHLVHTSGIVVLKGYSRETLTLQTRQRIWSEVQLLQVRGASPLAVAWQE